MMPLVYVNYALSRSWRSVLALRESRAEAKRFTDRAHRLIPRPLCSTAACNPLGTYFSHWKRFCAPKNRILNGPNDHGWFPNTRRHTERSDSCTDCSSSSMHQPAPVAQVGLLPSMYPFCPPSSLPEFSLGAVVSAPHLHKPTRFSNSWETRCLRKHRRRAHDEVCSAKRRRLMETEGALSDSCAPHPSVQWARGNNCSSVAPPSGPALPCPSPHTAPAPPTPGAHSSCMEVEAAQRRLREIEDRITLEDDSDSELEVEVCPRRPVLVLSDSLKEGLQRGLSDILPHTVAQSVSHSCMELVLWRPPEDPLSHRLKESLQRQRRQQQNEPRQPPTPCPSPAPHRDPPSPPLYGCPGPVPMPGQGAQGEEAMEM